MSRIEMVEPTTTPHPPIQPLGDSPLHGPPRRLHVVVILGVGPGLGLSIARTFSSRGYAVAILSRSLERLEGWAGELDSISRSFLLRSGQDREAKDPSPLCKAFSCDVLDNNSIRDAMRRISEFWPDRLVGTACYNASVRKRGPFLEQTEIQVQQGVQASIMGFYTFAQEVLSRIDSHGKGGNLIVTGATSSTRGRKDFAGFAASKSGLRAMVQSVAREYNPKGVHVSHVIVDGLIESQAAKDLFGFSADQRFKDGMALRPDEMAKTWLFLAQQQVSGWTFEMDLRPSREHF
ncbi:NAD(P)-binding protein [Violaceomyces palustris]|uniref:NAD(P)-binding protein n=1 Tax=Violaceomyces palustris TaxID=1673888 RepID=A0ACD0NLN1_9BASI|nr:NAD(P)-binding protein [Violaceomyces palustris]